MTKFYVYKTTNKVTGKIYIGVHASKNIDVDPYLGSGEMLRRSIRKHGKEVFIREILAEFNNADDAYKLGEDLVTEEFLLTNTYNICLGGRGSRPCNAARYRGAAKTATLLKGRTKKNHQGRKAQSEKISGQANPSKREDVRKKISESNSGANNAMFGKYGELSPKSKLTNEERLRLIHLFESNKYTRKELAKIFNVSYALVKKVIQFKDSIKNKLGEQNVSISTNRRADA